MTAHLYKRAFARAVVIAGGREQLANYLQKDLELVSKWSTLTVEPPVDVLQRIAQLLQHQLLKKYQNGFKERRVQRRRRNKAR